MNDTRILILDCKGASKPAICFGLDVAGFSTYVVTDENEAINLLSTARSIEKSFSCLIVNDYDPGKDPLRILGAIERSGVADSGCVIVFAGNREVASEIIELLKEKFSRLKFYTCQPAQTVDLVRALQKGSCCLHRRNGLL